MTEFDATEPLKKYVDYHLAACRETLATVDEATVALRAVAELRVLTVVEDLLRDGNAALQVRNVLQDMLIGESTRMLHNSDPLRVQMVAFLGDLTHRLGHPELGLRILTHPKKR